MRVHRASVRALTVALLAESACHFSSDQQRSSIDSELETELAAPNGIVVLFNPATCAFGPSIGAQLARVSEEARLPVRVVFFGIHSDSLSHLRVRKDFDLQIPSDLVTFTEAEKRFGVPRGGLPTLLVLKRGQLVLIAHGTALGSLDRWLPAFVGVRIASEE